MVGWDISVSHFGCSKEEQKRFYFIIIIKLNMQKNVNVFYRVYTKQKSSSSSFCYFDDDQRLA